MSDAITLSLGQIVHWPHAPDQLAQIVELRRKNVRIYYRKANGNGDRQPIVSPRYLMSVQDRCKPLMPFTNPFNRAIIKPKTKVYE